MRHFVSLLILTAIGALAFAAGFQWALAADENPVPGADAGARVVYPKRTELDFEGLQLEGEVRNPGEFYFQRRPEERFDSLVKRRKQFHQQMLRDVVLSR